MAGHSKWANIKHRKGAQDAIRAKIFNKFSKEIMVAAAKGGPDLNSNSALRMIVAKAKAKSMPKANIEKAIAKATGGASDGANFKELIYSGNLAHGVTLIVTILTDNVNRAISSLQALFRRANGQIGKQNAIPYIFEQKGLIEIDKTNLNEDEVMMFALENGANDFLANDETFEIYCEPRTFPDLKNAIEQKFNPEFKTVEISYFASEEVELSEELTEKLLNQIDTFLEDDDIQDVYHNLKV
ncbi:YebC/PmpR family DNA-binding transcriptional regulator [Mesomycoplasma bovoculi]|uniref:Probable transcriptional regulatory protein MYB_01985 n=1 Tax=Mesomycoplasma bovoculi M165/69 TaxID=743966 RepID=W5UTH2_9BACT|nr:YebC/PmpR family DNA-binding transcriptional regulator [Mesomycoplasma bovoculi]AHH45401.1 hypothetical protein MYB_01985 [Mesomycoplasma bovoculi M165/69]